MRAAFAAATSEHKDAFETVIVPDMARPGAYDEAVRGCKGLVHTANAMIQSDKWEVAVEPGVQGVRVALQAAHKEPGLTRFVHTSSSTALGLPTPPTVIARLGLYGGGTGAAPASPPTWTTETFNDAIVLAAKAQPAEWNTYAAAKVLAERALQDFVKEHDPAFGTTVICPPANFGPQHAAGTSASSSVWPLGFLTGETALFKHIPSEYFINVVDCARLHVAALLRPSQGHGAEHERVIAFTEVFRWRDVDEAIQAVKPEGYKGITDEQKQEEWYTELDPTIVDPSRMHELLGGKQYVADLPQTIRETFGAPIHPAAPSLKAA